ncbi:hypothetical protein ACFC14_13575 [Microbacterium sp. NPDC055988]|uniref:hypothetical protein n=1 Tax=Microbacterium sp. NPDC055988 TaxID=3345671 RepID=UPI0035DCA05F
MTTTTTNEMSDEQFDAAISTLVLRDLRELHRLTSDDEVASQLRAGLQKYGECLFGLALAIANGAVPSGPDELEGLWLRFYITTYRDRSEALEELLEHFAILPPRDELFADVDREHHGLLALDEERAEAALADRVFLVEGAEGVHAYLRYPEKPDNE